MLFSDLKLDADLQRGIDDAGYSVCTPVQEETLAHTVGGRDVCVQSQTGTGKTAAFVISLYQLMLGGEDKRDKALIIAPTRELVLQVQEEAKLLGVYLPLSVGAFYGGTGYGKQEDALRTGVDIMVATPGRLLDFANKGTIDLQSVGYLVIDEADRLFDMGFLPDLRRILKKMRPPQKRQTMLFSATLSFTARRLASEHMNNPYEVEISSPQVTVDTVEQELYHVGHVEKLSLLLGLLRREAPRNCMIFVNMKSTAERLAKRLSLNGLQCEYLSGDLPQSRRQRTIDRFKTGDISLLVATDVAARGIHIDELSLVINFDLPEDSEVYVHRIGRTARAGKSGKAISLACEHTVAALSGIEKLIGMRLPVAHASDDLYNEDISKNVHLPRSGRREHSGNLRKDSRNTPRSRTGSRRADGEGRKSTQRTPTPRRRTDREASGHRHHQERRRESAAADNAPVKGHATHPRPPESARRPSLLGRIAGMFGKKK